MEENKTSFFETQYLIYKIETMLLIFTRLKVFINVNVRRSQPGSYTILLWTQR